MITPPLSPITGEKALRIQLATLGRSKERPYAVVKSNNTVLYALKLVGNSIHVSHLTNPKDTEGEARHENGCKVYRFSENPKYPKTDGAEFLTWLGKQGNELFIIPNYIPLDQEGDNGIGADMVSECPSLFCEFDEGTIKEQWEKLNSFSQATGLTPSLVVHSGGKSLHIYFRFSEPIKDKQLWQRLQRKLIILFGSDPQIQNPNREMRLAGVDRASKGKHQSVQFVSDYSYTTSEIESALDASGKFPYGIDDERFRHWRREGDHVLALTNEQLNPQRSSKPRDNRPIDPLVEFPLEIVLTRHDRGLIERGVSKGERNSQGLKLAVNLGATADRLSQLGLSFSGTPEQLFEEFCARCSPALGARESEQIWRSASRGNPTPSLPDEVIENCIKAWEWNQRPEHEKRDHVSDPDPQAYAEYRAWEDEQDRVLEAERTSEFIEWLKAKASGLSKRFKKGFGQYQQSLLEATYALPKVIEFDPNVPLPLASDYEGKPAPRFKFKKGQRLKLIAGLKAKGWKFVLDRSFMGLGKSHDLGLLTPDEEGNNKIWYLDTNHRNVSTETVKNNFSDLDPRHEGLYRDDLGNLKRATDDEQKASAEVESNCYQADLFLKLKEKGYQTESKDSDGVNPICSGCIHHRIKETDEQGNKIAQCASSSGDGYGFRSQRQETLSRRNIRAAIDSLPNPEEYDYSSDIAVIEEASQVLRGTKPLTGTLRDFDSQMAEIEGKFPEAFAHLLPLRKSLRPYLNGEQKLPYHGLNHQELLEILGNPPENLKEIVEALKGTQPNIAALIEQPDSVRGCGGQWYEAGKTARSIFRREAAAKTQQNLDHLPVNFLVELLEVWGGFEPGALRISHSKQLTVTTGDARHSELINSFGFTVYLDATADKQLLAKRAGVDPNSIIEIEQETPELSNLKVHNIQMEGMRSGEWSDRCLGRIKALVAHLEELHPDIPLLGLKRYAKALSLNGWWHNHNRSTNQSKGENAVAAFGTPYINVGAAQDEYLSLFGSLDGFDQHYQRLIEAEFTQLVGRQRAHLYPDQQFKLYLVGTDQDVSFLEQYGINVINQDAFEVCPEAGTPKQAGSWGILKAIRAAVASGRELAKLTTTEIAERVGVSQGRISQLVKELGGWKELKKLLAPLLDPYRTINKIQRDSLACLLGFSPTELAGEVVSIVKAAGVDGFQIEASLNTQIELIGTVLGLLPQQVLEELAATLDLPPRPT